MYYTNNYCVCKYNKVCVKYTSIYECRTTFLCCEWGFINLIIKIYVCVEIENLLYIKMQFTLSPRFE